MIDPLLSLAFAMQSNKGVYALLLGSGVSRAAEIPTGWEIVLDLVRKLAQMQGEDCEPDPAAWYQRKYGVKPDYSKLLDAVAKSREERQQLLRSYFEPSEDEREQGLKQPTAAHRAIAELVAKGYVRVIVTTNFDRLIERAIEEAGITPTVISTPDAVDGALPIVHQQCCIVKIHGDYMDTRIKNTPDELAAYDGRMDHLLDRVFDEFGIVACGWSAQWDPALCAAFDRCKSRRFTLYWTGRGAVGDRAARLIAARAGVTVTIKDADSFFTELSEKVLALERIQSPHPRSVAAAVATTKRLLADEKHTIRLHDLVREETERAYNAIQPILQSFVKSKEQAEDFRQAIDGFRSCTEILRAVCVQLAYWGRSGHQSLVPNAITRLAVNPNEGKPGIHINETLRAIPSIMGLYVSGIAALAHSNIEMFLAVLRQPTVTLNGQKYPFLTGLDWPKVQAWIKALPGHERVYYPACEWLLIECRELLRSFLPGDEEYEHAYDRFELVCSLVHADLECGGKYKPEAEYIRMLPGRFVWKDHRSRRFRVPTLLDEVKQDSVLTLGLLKAGMYGGKRGTLQLVLEKAEAGIAQLAAWAHM